MSAVYKVENPEVLYTSEALTRLGQADVDDLKSRAAGNPRRRIRLCTHPDVGNELHEMIIVHARGAYVRPHLHREKSESFHLIEGSLQVVFLEPDGAVRDVLNMGPVGSGETFYHRLADPWFHTVIPTSEMVVFHETTNGPFRREDTVFAPWAPLEDDLPGRTAYQEQLAEAVSAHCGTPQRSEADDAGGIP